jgi:hypothetical protein
LIPDHKYAPVLGESGRLDSDAVMEIVDDLANRICFDSVVCLRVLVQSSCWIVTSIFASER